MTAPGAAPMPASMLSPMLSVDGLDVAYGDFQVLWQAAMHVDEGEIGRASCRERVCHNV